MRAGFYCHLVRRVGPIGFAVLVIGLGLLIPDTADAARRGGTPTYIRAAKKLAEEGRSTSVGLSNRRVEVVPGVTHQVRGKRHRRQVRFARLVVGFSGDKERAYETLGFPTFRRRETSLGRTTEHWTYMKEGVILVFQGDRLLRKEPY